MLARQDLGIVHLVLNTDCNAWDLRTAEGSPGVCRFCYRERNRVTTDPTTVRKVIDRIRAESEAYRLVLTGGDPLMPYDNHLEVALERAAAAGFDINLHTNGLLLSGRYAGIRDYVGVYSLAVDGPDAATADWFRGRGYFGRFRANVDMLVRDGRRLAFNTFTSRESADRLPEVARLIADIATRTPVEYWLISQYRPIGRPSQRKRELYAYPPDEFSRAVYRVRDLVTGVEVYAQPTRSPDDPYPFRVWVLGDGIVTVDLGSVAAPRNDVPGDLLTDGFEHLVRRSFALRDQQQREGQR